MGNLASKTDFGGATSRFTYDALKRLLSAQLPDGTSKSYSYDGNGNLTNAENPAGKLSYVYDPLNRIVKSVDTALAQTIEYSYDPAGNRTALRWGDGRRSTTYTYGKMNELLNVKDPEGEVTTYGYDALLREVTRSLPNNLVTRRGYDPAGRLTEIKNEVMRGRGEQEKLSSEAYLYNPAGQRTYTISSDGGITAYTYDAAGRLAQVLSPLNSAAMKADLQERLALGLYPQRLRQERGRGDEHDPRLDFSLPKVPEWNSKSLVKELFALLEDEADEQEGAGRWSVKPGEGATDFASRLSVDTPTRKSLQDAYRTISERRRDLDTQQWVWTQRYRYDPQGNRVAKADGWGRHTLCLRRG